MRQSIGAEVLDDAVVAKGGADEVSHRWGSCGAMVSHQEVGRLCKARSSAALRPCEFDHSRVALSRDSSTGSFGSSTRA